MKPTNILFLIIGLLLLNPRVDLINLETYPRFLVSCSTGWSLQWRKGVLGLYSLEAASELRQTLFKLKANNSFSQEGRALNSNELKKRIMKPCN